MWPRPSLNNHNRGRSDNNLLAWHASGCCVKRRFTLRLMQKIPDDHDEQVAIIRDMTKQNEHLLAFLCMISHNFDVIIALKIFCFNEPNWKNVTRNRDGKK